MSPTRGLFWVLVLATGVVYALMVAWSLPRIAGATGGLSPFDLRPMGYDLAEAQAFLAALDPASTRFYLDVQQSLDLLFPGLLSAVLVMAYHALAPGWLRWPAIGLALAAAAADWMENWLVARLLTQGAVAATPEMVADASTATVAKSVLSALTLSLLLGLVVRRYLSRRELRDG